MGYRVPVSYEETVGDVAKVAEAVGVVILVVGAIGAFSLYARDLLMIGPGLHHAAQLDGVILPVSEVLIIGDIVRTIVVAPTLVSVAVLGSHRADPDRAQLLARGRDRRHLALEPLAQAPAE